MNHSTLRNILVRGAALALLSLPPAAPAQDKAAPDFTLKSASGVNLKLSEHRGQVVMINFWATWCGPCRQEMPELNKLYEKYRTRGFQLLGVNIDEQDRAARSMAGKLGVRFPVLFDTDKSVSRLYDVSVMPTTVLVDRSGRWRHTHRGFKAGAEALYESQIRELLKEGAR